MHCFFETVTARKGQKIACIECGPDSFDIFQGRKISSFLNRSLLLTSRNREDFCSCSAPVLSMMITPKKRLVMSRDETYADMLDQIMDMISESPGVKKVVLDSKPDELYQNKPKQLSPSPSFFPVMSYKQDIRRISEDFEDTFSNADVLLRTRFPKSMWGAGKISKWLLNLKNAADKISANSEQFEAATEISDKKASILDQLIRSEDHKQIVSELISNIIENFFIIKKTLSSTVHDLYRLYDITGVFKKYTGYPPTWFFDSSVFYDFQYGFENLIKHLIRMARTEGDLIEPLYNLKVKYTGE